MNYQGQNRNNKYGFENFFERVITVDKNKTRTLATSMYKKNPESDSIKRTLGRYYGINPKEVKIRHLRDCQSIIGKCVIVDGSCIECNRPRFD